MAGICGIIRKSYSHSEIDYNLALKKMIGKLGVSPTQPSANGQSNNVYWCNVSLLNDAQNSNYIFDQTLNIICIIEGLVFIDESIRNALVIKYGIRNTLEDKKLLPYLYKEYASDLVNHITGWYNIFLINNASQDCLLINDRLGYLPLFYYEDEYAFIFSSKIESILASGLLKNIEFDVVSISEQLYFNYILSENTLIKNIKTLPPSTTIAFDNNGFNSNKKYWSFNQFFVDKPSNKKDGVALLDAGMKKAFSKLSRCNTGKIKATLTGGWDSRLVLSYLRSFKENLHLYSFGATNSPDIKIPEIIAHAEGFEYTPYVLDELYLSKYFKANAQKTIIQSNGSRNFKRTHYMYAIEQASQNSYTTISGIFGDEVLKIAGASPGDVISKNTLEFISSNFDVDDCVSKYSKNNLWDIIPFKQEYTDELSKRMSLIKDDTSTYETLNQKYYYIRFMINLRKYFGAEVNSYNDYSYNFSPFIDYDFLSSYFKSFFCGVFYPYQNHSLRLKRQTTILYGTLIASNYKKLLQYKTDRGYPMSDALSVTGMLNIMIQRFFKSKSHSDSYNTLATTPIFKEIIKSSQTPNEIPILLKEKTLESNNTNAMSVLYWMQYIASTYQNK